MYTEPVCARTPHTAPGKVANRASFLLLAAALVAGPGLASGCTSAQMTAQQTAHVTTKAGYPTLGESRLGAGSARASERGATKTVYHGRAPYICTPSGFGRTSGCFLRS